MKNEKQNYAIGLYGVNGAGKSVLSKELMACFSVCELQSTDNLLKIYKHLNPKSPYRNLVSYTAWQCFGKKTEKNIAKGFAGYRNLLFDYLDCLIQRVPAEKLTMIFDGIHFDPRLKETNKDVQIVPILLTLKNSEIQRQRIMEKSGGREELEEILLSNIETSRNIQDYLIREAKQRGVFILDTGTDSVVESLNKIINAINA